MNGCILKLELDDNLLYRNLKLSVSDCPVCYSTLAEHLRSAAKSKSATSRKERPLWWFVLKANVAGLRKAQSMVKYFALGCGCEGVSARGCV